jgi:hypothetical protein
MTITWNELSGYERESLYNLMTGHHKVRAKTPEDKSLLDKGLLVEDLDLGVYLSDSGYDLTAQYLMASAPNEDKQDLAALRAERDALAAEMALTFRWLYAAVVNKAQECLAQANAQAEPGAWPAGQEWRDLVDSSRSTFLHQARDAMHIPHEPFLAIVRKWVDEIEDIYDNGSSALNT